MRNFPPPCSLPVSAFVKPFELYLILNPEFVRRIIAPLLRALPLALSNIVIFLLVMNNSFNIINDIRKCENKVTISV